MKIYLLFLIFLINSFANCQNSTAEADVTTDETTDDQPSTAIIILLIVIAVVFASSITGGVVNYLAYKKKLISEHRQGNYELENYSQEQQQMENNKL